MRHNDAQKRLTRYRERAEEAKRALDNELRQVVPPVAIREVDRLRKEEAEALRLLIVSELYAGLVDDPDTTAVWMLECIETGVIAEPHVAAEGGE